MNILILDVETTIFAKGNPYSRNNKLVCIGLKLNDNPIEVHYVNDTYENSYLKELLSDHDTTITGFNLKFDLAWLQRYGLYDPYTSQARFHDCQLVEFIINRQQKAYPSLEDTCIKYKLGQKDNTIAENYWDKGIDTDLIPREELTKYLITDIQLTHDLYRKQQELVKPSMKNLVSLMNQDLSMLQAMEENGLYMDMENISGRNLEITSECSQIEERLSDIFEIQTPVNYSSYLNVSALLYGGVIEFEQKVQVGVFKTGEKAGLPKYKTMIYRQEYPQLIKPIRNSELNAPNTWSTSTEILKQLKPNKKTGEIIELLIKRSELLKLSTTYLSSFPKLNTEMNWTPNTIHGKFNQCVAITGRLSSSNPNLQNLPKEIKQFIRSRHE